MNMKNPTALHLPLFNHLSSLKLHRASVAFAIAALSCVGALAGPVQGSAPSTNRFDKMSPAGQRAAAEVDRILHQAPASRAPAALAVANAKGGDELCVNAPDCEEDLSASAAPGGQAEISIAVDKTGQHIVVGFNDTRGFALNPLSVSGVLYSEDGGKTFVDGGQLPSPGNQLIGTAKFPRVFGDPDVKYLGDCTFIYASIIVDKLSAAAAVQSMGVHRSTDCGKTWEGPFVIAAASNPNGLLSASGAPQDAADKEYMDVDPDTGRVIMSWSNFTPVAVGGVEIRTTYSDNVKTGATPLWSTGSVVAATADDGQGSVPRFARGNNNVYVAWARFPFPGTFQGFGGKVAFARSLDNGATWQAPIEVSNEFFSMDQVLGNDRVNNFPSLAVDNSRGGNRGAIYLVYANNNSGDGADIVFQKSTDQGVSFSTPIEINASPGQDRAQWFPWVTVDNLTGRVHVFYYDQGIDKTGDLTEVSYVYSDDGGTHWSAPVPLTKRPFHAGWGNDTGQPNLGDYIQAVAQNGDFFAGFALASRPPRGFVDGQPTLGNMTVPDVEVRRVQQFGIHGINTLPLSIDVNKVVVIDSGGNGVIDSGETVRVRLPLTNYTRNELSEGNALAIRATLTSDTPGVQVTQSFGVYGVIAPGDTANSFIEYRLRIAPTFVPGTPIDLKLRADGIFHHNVFATAELHHSLFSGTPSPTLLLSENFDGVAPGALPVGWQAAHGGGSNVVPWTTSNTFCGSSNAAFHQNANDNPAGSATRFERLFSPIFSVPANSDYVTVEFDVCTDTEEDPNFNVLAYDGLVLRVLDATPGNITRSVLVEAFADEFTTGNRKHYPRHFPRSGNPAYFQDMSAWAGDSHGAQHVKLRLPGMAGTMAQLRFEFTQDAGGTCVDLGRGPVCGVSVDNVVISSVRAVTQPTP